MAEEQSKSVYHLFVKLLDGKTLTLRFNSPTISGETLTQQIYKFTQISPQTHLLLLAEGRHVSYESLISSNDNFLFPTVNVLSRLLGGKGGFGSLLRGAATKAGQKKTNNFDACRDMSGRRLRHVNAEKKLEEWRMEEEERRLEKVAEQFLKKKMKEKGHVAAGDSADKYVEKYREESAKCVAEVEVAVREAIRGKRKSEVGKGGLNAKKLKIWLGKKKMEESDSDMEEDGTDNNNENEENENSVVLNDGHSSDLSKEVEGSSSSVSGGKLDGESSGGVSCESGSEEEKEIVVRGSLKTSGSAGVSVDPCQGNGVVELENPEELLVESGHVSCLEAVVVSETEVVDAVKLDAETNGFPESVSGMIEDKVTASTTSDVEKPLNFDEYSSAAEMEVLGMDRLKSELLARGLKCGGTVQERTARLFLLKTTPLEKLPKKLLAKK